MAEEKTGDQAAEDSKPMSFKHTEYVRHLSENYRNRLGWSIDMAEEAARIASDVLRENFGGGSVYIAARSVDRKRIAAEYDGSNVASLARRHGVSAKTIRRIVSR